MALGFVSARLAVTALTAGALLALSGCCTRAGCEDRVTWELPASFPGLAPSDTVRVRACFDSACTEGPLTGEAGGQLWSSADGRVLLFLPSQVSFSIGSTVPRSGLATLELSRNGRALVTDSRQVTLSEASQPNGPLCPPTCFGARVRL
jgi:hypothetical protein